MLADPRAPSWSRPPPRSVGRPAAAGASAGLVATARAKTRVAGRFALLSFPVCSPVTPCNSEAPENETDGRLTDSHSSSGSEDLGGHDEPQHAPSGHKAAPGGFFSFPHEGGTLAEPRMAGGGTGGPSPRSGPKSLNDAVPVLTSDPNATAKVFVEEEIAGHEKLEQLTDKELLTRAARELAITGIVISRALQGHVDALVPTKVGELAVLVRALAASLKAVTAGFKQAVAMRPGKGSRHPVRCQRSRSHPYGALRSARHRRARERKSKAVGFDQMRDHKSCFCDRR